MTVKVDEILKGLLANVDSDKLQKAEETEEQRKEAAASMLAKAIVTLISRMQVGSPVVEKAIDPETFSTRVRMAVTASIRLSNQLDIDYRMAAPYSVHDFQEWAYTRILDAWMYDLIEGVMGIKPGSLAHRMLCEEIEKGKFGRLGDR